MATIILLTLSSAEVQIIASKSCKVSSMSKNDVKKLFLLKKRLVDGKKIVVLDRTEATLYAKFIEQYLKKSSRKMRAYWVRMLFTGKVMPPKKVSLEELKMLSTKGTCHISYLKEKQGIPNNWNTITVK